jgi:hypothetical protein
MLERNRLVLFVWYFLILCAGVSSFLALRPATVIPKNQAITTNKFECQFVAFQRDEVGAKNLLCVDENSLKSALVVSACLGGVTLSALGCIVFRKSSRTVSEWRENLGSYLVLVGTWIWLTVLFVAAIRLTNIAYGRVNVEYLYVTLIWVAIAAVLPLIAWMKSE